MASCRNHPTVAAVGRCVGCAEEFCGNCLVEILGQQYCGSCKVMTLQGKIPAAAMAAAQGGNRPNSSAKEALTLAIVGIFCFGFILGPIAIFKSVQAKNEIARDPNLGGGGVATAALIIAIVATAMHGLWCLTTAAGMAVR